jgi:hypothetical protein
MSLRTLVVFAFAAAALPIAAQRTQTSHFVRNGDFGQACFSTYDQSGTIFTSSCVYVSRGGTPQSPQTFLSFYVARYNYADGTYGEINGNGIIPNGSLVGNPQTTLTLTVDLALLDPNVFSQYSYGTPLQPTSTVVSATFQQTNTVTRFNSGVYREIYRWPWATYKYQSQGATQYSSATGSLNLLGLVSASVEGNVGSDHGVSIEITRTAN